MTLPANQSRLIIKKTLYKSLLLSLVVMVSAIVFMTSDMSLLFGPSLLERIKQNGELIMLTRKNPTTYYEGPEGPAGLEYDMAKLFADELGVKLKVVVPKNLGELLEDIKNGKAHIAAAGLTVTEERKKVIRFGPGYQEITEQLIYNVNYRKPKDLSDVGDDILEVVANSSHNERLVYLKKVIKDLQWKQNHELESAELLQLVADEIIDYTIADSNEALLNKRFLLNLRSAFDISTPQTLAWALHKGHDNSLYLATVKFFEKIKSNGQLNQLIERTYGHVKKFDYVGTILFKRHIAQRLPQFIELFKEYAEIYDIDWRLLAAMSYQESHWKTSAKSPTGVRGLMMLTKTTAKQMGIKDRVSAEGSIRGGAKYYAQMRDRINHEIPSPDREWMALAAYNVGLYHLRDAQIIIKQLGKDPNKWSDVKHSLPLLAKRRWYKKTKHGYARGWEPVQYVENIRSYFDILVWADESETKVEPEPDVFSTLPQVP